MRDFNETTGSSGDNEKTKPTHRIVMKLATGETFWWKNKIKDG